MKTFEKGYQETKAELNNRFIIKEKLLYIVSIPLLMLLLTVFVFHFYRIDGPSMEKTLRHNDRVVINKLPKTWAQISGHQYIPQRYEVVVLKNPNKSGEKEIIKRVVALPGERIVVLNNDVRVFNSLHPEGLLVDRTAPAEAVIDDVTAGYIDTVLGPGEVFVLGDNREASYDSRELGPLKTSEIIGTLKLRVYPFRDISFY